MLTGLFKTMAKRKWGNGDISQPSSGDIVRHRNSVPYENPIRKLCIIATCDHSIDAQLIDEKWTSCWKRHSPSIQNPHTIHIV